MKIILYGTDCIDIYVPLQWPVRFIYIILDKDA